jgi:hypothetical protein
MLAVSNGLINVLPYVNRTGDPTGDIQIGVCPSGYCSGQTTIYSEGSIVAATDKSLQLDDAVRYGTRHLTLALSNINVGSTAGLADAAARKVLPAGLTLTSKCSNVCCAVTPAPVPRRWKPCNCQRVRRSTSMAARCWTPTTPRPASRC